MIRSISLAGILIDQPIGLTTLIRRRAIQPRTVFGRTFQALAASSIVSSCSLSHMIPRMPSCSCFENDAINYRHQLSI
jgi:hypothetical protein